MRTLIRLISLPSLANGEWVDEEVSQPLSAEWFRVFLAFGLPFPSGHFRGSTRALPTEGAGEWA